MVRSDIFPKTPILSLNYAYSVVVQDESQRRLEVIDINQNSLSLLASKDSRFKSRKSITGETIGIILVIVCEHYDFQRYLMKNCYRLVGYPPDFKRKKHLGTQPVNGPLVGRNH